MAQSRASTACSASHGPTCRVPPHRPTARRSTRRLPLHLQAQYINRVAGFGGSAGSDEYGRPIALLMSWTVGSADFSGNWQTTPLFRYLADDAGTPRGTILHELVHGLGFGAGSSLHRCCAGCQTFCAARIVGG